MHENITLSVTLLGLFASTAFIIVSVVRALTRAKRDRYYAEVSGKLVEKLGTGPDIMSFVESDAYKNLLGERETHGGPGAYASRILNTLQSGTVLLCTGAGMQFVTNFVRDPDASLFLHVVGGILMAIGIGLVLSAGWSYLLLKRWGLLTGEKANG